MNTGARETENDVARRNVLAGQHLGPLDRADAETGKVVVAFRIHARHLGGFAADQRAAGLPAAVRDRGDNRAATALSSFPVA